MVIYVQGWPRNKHIISHRSEDSGGVKMWWGETCIYLHEHANMWHAFESYLHQHLQDATQLRRAYVDTVRCYLMRHDTIRCDLRHGAVRPNETCDV